MNALLEKAKAVQVERKSTNSVTLNTDELGLFVALTKGEVTTGQAATALGIPSSDVEGRRIRTFKIAIRSGALQIV